MKLLVLTARQEDKAADEIVRRVQRFHIKSVFGVSKGGVPLAIKISYRMDELPVVFRVEEITSETLVVEDIIHSGKTIGRLLQYLKAHAVEPKVACWIWRKGVSYKPHIIIRTIKSKTPVQFPSETKKSALASFKKSEQGR